MKQNKKMTIPIIIAVAMSILTVWSVIYQQLKENKDNEEKIKDKNENLRISNELINTQNKLLQNSQILADSTNKIVELQAKIIEANEKINKLQEELLNTMTGGGAIPLIEFNVLDKVKNKILFSFFNPTSYPIHDVVFLIVEQFAIPDKDNITEDEIHSNYTSRRKFGTLGPNSLTEEFYSIEAGVKVDSITFEVIVSWRGGNYRITPTLIKSENGNFSCYINRKNAIYISKKGILVSIIQ